MLSSEEIIKFVLEELKKNEGILRLKPVFVPRTFSTPGKRLGLPMNEYDKKERGGICERWIGSTTVADNPIPVENEGLNYLNLSSGEDVTLRDAVKHLAVEFLGKEYAASHDGLGRLAKILDYSDRLPYHIHQMEKHARLMGCNSKEEAYYFPEDVPMGKHPETFFGVHPYIAREKQYEVLLPHMIAWQDDSILKHARAFKQMPNDGFHVPAGTLHAPGTALTIEFQEDSDVFAMMQARTGDVFVDKKLLFKDVRPEDIEKFGEKIILEMINWDVSGDPFFFENRHTPPILIEETKQSGGEEYWIFYNTDKFSGKKLVVHPGVNLQAKMKESTIFLSGGAKGVYGGIDIEGENFLMDELVVTFGRSINNLTVTNTGDRDLIIYKFFGPDVNKNVPKLKKYPTDSEV